MRLAIFSLLCALGLGLTAHAQAQTRTFTIDGGQSQAQFVSVAPLERITGVAGKVKGQLTLDPAKPGEARGEVRVPISSIRTNVELRDEHLQSDSWLDAARFPDAIFTLGSVSGTLAENQASELKVNGKFSVHGVSHDVSTTARVRYTPGADSARDQLRVQASFTVHLESYGVSIPSIVALKVAKDIQVNVDLKASAEKPAAQPPVAVAPVEPTPPAPRAEAPTPEAKPAAPTEKPRAAAKKPATPAATKPSAPSAQVADKPRETTPAPAHQPGPTPPAPAPPAATVTAPRTPQEAAARVQALLRKAHHELMHGDKTIALRSVQQAQKLMPLVQTGLGTP